MTEKWDAGDIGCGRLAMELGNRVNALKPGQRLEITITDAGAAHDIPAWCRMTGNELISAEHPVYLVERKNEPGA